MAINFSSFFLWLVLFPFRIMYFGVNLHVAFTIYIWFVVFLNLEENRNFYDIRLDCDFLGITTKAQEVKNKFHQSLKPSYIEAHGSPKNRRRTN